MDSRSGPNRAMGVADVERKNVAMSRSGPAVLDMKSDLGLWRSKAGSSV